MSKKRLKRGFLLIAGILSVTVIVLTQSFYKPTTEEIAKTKTEQNKPNDPTCIQAPADVVSNGSTLAFNENPPIVPPQTAISEQPNKAFAEVKQGLFKLFRTLFRTTIAPNAP